MQRRIIKMRGESLLEIVVAVSILATIMTSVFALLIRGAAANVNVTNRVVAINLAREGIEAVRNIRDTNWLKYSGDRRNKWLCYDTVGSPDACAGAANLTLAQGTYVVEFNETANRYYLGQQNLNPSMTERKELPDESFRLFVNDATERFEHNSGAGMSTTPYYRQIYLTPESEYVTPACVLDGCPRNERMLVSVRVQWMEDSAVRSMDMETYLYDYLGRDEY